MDRKLWEDAAKRISKAGNAPFSISDTIIEILQTLMSEQQARFLLVFETPSLSFDQLKEKTQLDDSGLIEMLESLMSAGVITGTTSSKGIRVYRLMSLFPGMFEFSMMKGETGEKDKRLAKLYDRFFDELSRMTQSNYDNLLPVFRQSPPIDRVVPVGKVIDTSKDTVIPLEEASQIIAQCSDIGLAYCYCRHEKDLLDEPCRMNAPRETCLLLGKTAKFAIEYNFARPITKGMARKILSEAGDFGLIHKVFHVDLNPEKDVMGICNCCSCCCGTFQLYNKGAMPLHTTTSYMAKIDQDSCTGCETCVEMCPMETIEMEDGTARIIEGRCIGCGICAHHCPEDAIRIERTGPRNVFVPPITAAKDNS